jgi:hypothetical protein
MKIRNLVFAGFAAAIFAGAGISGASAATIASQSYVDTQDAALQANITTNASAIGTLASLTTTQKSNLVGAINEIKTVLGTVSAGDIADLLTATDAATTYAVKATEGVASTAASNASTALSNIGTLASLTTTEKSTVVGAINEIKTILGALDATSVSNLVTTVTNNSQDITDIQNQITNLGNTYATDSELSTALAGEVSRADLAYAVKATEGVASGAASAAAAAQSDATSALTNIGTLASLNTTAKGSVVAAINEIKTILGTTDAATIADLITLTEANANYAVKATEGVASGAASAAATNATAIGTLASLTTTEKSNLVGAINELKTVLGTTTAAEIADLITETAADIKYAVKSTETVASTNATNIGTIGSLATTATNLVGAVNEVRTTANAAVPTPQAACSAVGTTCVLAVAKGTGTIYWEEVKE